MKINIEQERPEYINPAIFKEVMTAYQGKNDPNVITGTNWINPFNNIQIVYNLSYDSIYRSSIYIKDYEKRAKDYFERYKESDLDGSATDPDAVKVYYIKAIINDVLKEDSTSKIMIIDSITNDTYLNEEIKGADTLTIKVPSPNIGIITIGDCTVYQRVDYILQENNIINLNPIIDVNNFEVNQATQIKSMVELIDESGVDYPTIKRMLDSTTYGLKKLGNHEYITGSIQCWLATRFYKAPANESCDYSEDKIVKHLDNEMRIMLNEKLNNTKPLTLIELNDLFNHGTGFLFIEHNGERIPISKNKVILSTSSKVKVKKADDLQSNMIDLLLQGIT